MALNPVHAVLVAHGTRSLWHYTLVERLPGMLREGAIYARAELASRGIECSSTHYYGDPDKERLLAEYVSCATMPPWGMMGNETEELAIVDISPGVVATSGTCFCPGWSPQARFVAADIVTWTTPAHAAALYSGTGYLTVPGAEIFVPARSRGVQKFDPAANHAIRVGDRVCAPPHADCAASIASGPTSPRRRRRSRACPAVFGNSDIFGGSFADPTP